MNMSWVPRIASPRFDKPVDGLPVMEDWITTFESMFFHWHRVEPRALGLHHVRKRRPVSLTLNMFHQHFGIELFWKYISPTLWDWTVLELCLPLNSPWRSLVLWLPDRRSDQGLDEGKCHCFDLDCMHGTRSLRSSNSRPFETAPQGFGQMLGDPMPCFLAPQWYEHFAVSFFWLFHTCCRYSRV